MTPEQMARRQAEVDARIAALSPQERAEFDKGAASLQRVMNRFAEWYGGAFKVDPPLDPDEP